MVEVAQESAVETTASVVYASWGRRFAALLVDWCLLGAATVAVLTIFLVVVAGRARGSGFEWGIAIVFITGLLMLAIGIAYFAVLHGAVRGQTVGKMMVGIAVRRAQSLERVGYPRALLRTLATLLVWVGEPTAEAVADQPMGIGIVVILADYLWPLWDSRNQALHDKFSGTVVVRV